MNKAQLTAEIAERLNTTQKNAAAYVDAFFITISDTVARGERVTVTGFGTFEPKERPAREFHNLATGQRGKVPATTVPKFTAGADFKNRVKTARAA